MNLTELIFRRKSGVSSDSITMSLGWLTLAGISFLFHQSYAFAQDCNAENGAEFICNVDNVEDFARLPNGQVIGSDLVTDGKKGNFFLFNRDRTVRRISEHEIAVSTEPTFLGCPGAPDWNFFAPHGMDIVMKGNKGTLYTVNHGGREAVEVFDVDLTHSQVKLTWTGCLVPPDDSWPDDVAILPDGGLLVSSLWNPHDSERLEKLIKGEPIGELLEWHDESGWSTVPGTEKLSGPNGVIVDRDGLKIYLAAWSGKQIVVIDRKDNTLRVIDLDYTPDNLSWSSDGKTIFIGGTQANVKDALSCFMSSETNCPWTGVRIDNLEPKTMKIRTMIKGNHFGQFGMATGAIDIDDELWVNSYRSDRVAIFRIN